MRRYLLFAAVMLALAAGVAADTTYSLDHSNGRGFSLFEGNEQTVGSTIDDPPKNRLTSPIYTTGGGGGVVSFNASFAPGDISPGSSQHEMAFIRVEQDSRCRGDLHCYAGEYNFFANDGKGAEDVNMRRALSFTYDHITNISPGIAADIRAIAGGAYTPPAPPEPAHSMVSPNGRFVTQQQDDGNFVTYDTQATPWKAVWSAWTGHIQ